MTGSVMGPSQVGLNNGFGRPQVMIVIGDPDNVIFAPSGTLARDLINDALYMNNSAGDEGTSFGAGSEWQTYT